jgi:hypothetical protein
MIKKLSLLNSVLLELSLYEEAAKVNLLLKSAASNAPGTAPARLLSIREILDKIDLPELRMPKENNERIIAYSRLIEQLNSKSSAYQIDALGIIGESISNITDKFESDAESSGINLDGSSKEEGIKILREGTLFEGDKNDDGLVNPESPFDGLGKVLTGLGFSDADAAVLTAEAERQSQYTNKDLIKDAGVFDAIGDGAKWIGKGAWKGLSSAGKGLFRALPWVGLFITIPTLIKNFIEAVENGKKIISELPLEKYGLSKTVSLSPIGVKDSIVKAVEENREDPDSIGEIIQITQVLESYYVDFMKVITNTFFLILDIAGIIGVAGATIPIVGWTAALGATALNVGLSLGLVGIELGAEYYSDSHWKEVYDQILNICQEEIDEERSRIATEGVDRPSVANPSSTTVSA